MLENTVTLPVDAANNGTPVDQVFTRHDEYQNRSVYNGPNHTLVARDQLSFYRTAVKKSGNFLGTAKTSAKFSRDFSVPSADGGTIVVPGILEISFSFPVGLSATQMKELRQRGVALLDTEAVISRLTELQEI